MDKRGAIGVSRRTALARLARGAAALAMVGWAADNCRAASLVVTFAAIARSDYPPDVQSLQVGDRDGAVFVDAGTDRLDAAGRGFWWTTSNRGQRVWRISRAAVMSPEMFGAILDNAGDATPAINAGARFLADNGGGTLRFKPSKTYRLASADPSTRRTFADYTASIAFPAGARNLHFDLNGATLLQACNAYSFGPGYALFNTREVAGRAQPLARAALRGQTSVDLAQAPQDVNPGDCVMLVAGNTQQAGPRFGYTPIAEMLLVASLDGRTVHFTEPLSKDYAPMPGYPFGLVNANAISIHNCSLIGPGTVINRYRRTGNVVQAYGFEFRDINSEGRGGFSLRGRHIRAYNTTATLRPDWSRPLFRPYALAIDTGSNDVLIDGLNATADFGVAILHLHEGIADLTARNIVIRNGTVPAPKQTEPWASISVLATSWFVSISNATVINNPQGPGLEAREAVSNGRGNKGLRLSNIRFEGNFAAAALLIDDRDPTTIDGLDFTGAHRLSGGELMTIRGSPPRHLHVVGLS